MPGFWLKLLVFLGLCLLVIHETCSSALGATTELISINSSGEQITYSSEQESRVKNPAVSGDGRFVVFDSTADNLAPDDTNGVRDVFIRDRLLGTTERVSIGESGQQGNGRSESAVISANGRFVGFSSRASNLVSGDTNNSYDAFIRDLVQGTTILVSKSSAGELGNGHSSVAAITPDGRFVLLNSRASNLVPSDTNDTYDVFMLDRTYDTIERISVNNSGQQANGGSEAYRDSITPDGRFIVFASHAENMGGGSSRQRSQVYLRDRVMRVTEVIGVTVGGWPPNGNCRIASISADGRYVVFWSQASNLLLEDASWRSPIFLRDRLTGVTESLGLTNNGEQVNGSCEVPGISANGRFVVFRSEASNLVTGDTNSADDAFVHDLLLGRTERVSVGADGEQGNLASCIDDDPTISDMGQFIAFTSAASNFVSGDTNEERDIFLRDRGPFQIFFDIPLESWAASEIGACYRAGIIMGYPDGSYRPDLEVTRDQMAVFISRAIAGGDAGIPERFWGGSSFLDVPLDYWAYRYIEFAHRQHVVEGVTSNLYEPTLPVDRAQMAVFIARALVAPRGDAGLSDYHPPTNPTFPDVPGNFWAYKYIEYIADPARAVTQGYPDGFYHPDAICTRDQMAVFVARGFKLE